MPVFFSSMLEQLAFTSSSPPEKDAPAEQPSTSSVWILGRFDPSPASRIMSTSAAAFRSTPNKSTKLAEARSPSGSRFPEVGTRSSSRLPPMWVPGSPVVWSTLSVADSCRPNKSSVRAVGTYSPPELCTASPASILKVISGLAASATR